MMSRVRLVIALLLSGCLCIFSQENVTDMDEPITSHAAIVVDHNLQARSADEGIEIREDSDRLTKYLESIGTVMKNDDPADNMEKANGDSSGFEDIHRVIASNGELIEDDKDQMYEEITDDGDTFIEYNMEMSLENEQGDVKVGLEEQRESNNILKPLEEERTEDTKEIVAETVFANDRDEMKEEVTENGDILIENNEEMSVENGQGDIEVVPEVHRETTKMATPLTERTENTQGIVAETRFANAHKKAVVATTTTHRERFFDSSMTKLQSDRLNVNINKGVTKVPFTSSLQMPQTTQVRQHMYTRLQTLPVGGYPYANPLVPYPVRPVTLVNRQFIGYPYPSRVNRDTEDVHTRKIVKRHLLKKGHSRPHSPGHVHQGHLRKLVRHLEEHKANKHGFVNHLKIMKQEPNSVVAEGNSELLDTTVGSYGGEIGVTSTVVSGEQGSVEYGGSHAVYGADTLGSISNEELSGSLSGKAEKSLGGGLGGSISSRGLTVSLEGPVGKSVGGVLWGSISSKGLSGYLGGSVGIAYGGGLKGSIKKREMADFSGSSTLYNSRGLQGSTSNKGLHGLGGSGLWGGVQGSTSNTGLSGSIAGALGRVLVGKL